MLSLDQEQLKKTILQSVDAIFDENAKEKLRERISGFYV